MRNVRNLAWSPGWARRASSNHQRTERDEDAKNEEARAQRDGRDFAIIHPRKCAVVLFLSLRVYIYYSLDEYIKQTGECVCGCLYIYFVQEIGIPTDEGLRLMRERTNSPVGQVRFANEVHTQSF